MNLGYFLNETKIPCFVLKNKIGYCPKFFLFRMTNRYAYPD